MVLTHLILVQGQHDVLQVRKVRFKKHVAYTEVCSLQQPNETQK